MVCMGEGYNSTQEHPNTTIYTVAFGTWKSCIMFQNDGRIERSQFCHSFETYHKFWGAKWAPSFTTTLHSSQWRLSLDLIPKGPNPIKYWGICVLCHHSPRRISLAFGQHPLYSVGNPYICATAIHEPGYSSLLSLTLLTSTFASSWHFAHAQAEPPEPRHRLICNRHIYHVCASRSWAQPCVSITLETSHECGGNRDNGDSKWRQSATQRQ